MVVATGSSVLFAGDVPINGEVIITNKGDCVPDEFTVLISATGSSQVIQLVSVNTRCTMSGIPLGAAFGAVEFTGYTCQNGSSSNCWTTAHFQACAINEGSVPLTVIEYTLEANGNITDLLNSNPISLPTGESYCPPPEEIQLYLCEASIYTACSEVTAEGPSETMCEHKSPVGFVIEQPETVPPTPAPTIPPTVAPTMFPATPAPTLECIIEVSGDCANCDYTTDNLPGCEERPTMFGMLYRGGNCDENNFTQPDDKVSCADFNGGPPKMGSNATSYIEYFGKDITEPPFFTGTVQEGDVFYLYNGGEKLDADFNFNIYTDSSKGTLLQSAFFHASCSQPLVLKNVFGATQVVQFANSLQGNVSCFIATEVSYTITIPVSLPPGEDTLIIRELSIRTNYTNPAFIDFSAAVNGTEIGPGTQPLEVSIEATLNLAVPQAYETILIVSGETAGSGQICRGADYGVFFAPINEAPPGWAPPVPTASAPTAPAPTAVVPTSATLIPVSFPTVLLPTVPTATEPTVPTAPTAPVEPPTVPTTPAAPPTVPTTPVAPPTVPNAPAAPVEPPPTPAAAPVEPAAAPVEPPSVPTAPSAPLPSAPLPTAPIAPPITTPTSPVAPPIVGVPAPTATLPPVVIPTVPTPATLPTAVFPAPTATAPITPPITTPTSPGPPPIVGVPAPTATLPPVVLPTVPTPATLPTAVFPAPTATVPTVIATLPPLNIPPFTTSGGAPIAVLPPTQVR
jgi:hypothetical protein